MMPHSAPGFGILTKHRSMTRRSISIIFVLMGMAAAGFAQQRTIRVNVLDANGAAIENAAVRVSYASQKSVCPKDDGAYSCRVATDRAVSFEITAAGFRTVRERFARNGLKGSEYVFVMQVGGVDASVVTITRTETQIGDSPESITAVDQKRLAVTAAPTMDDALRQVPGFSIFRRSSSRNANPTSQGVSLRGVGASGASRSIVMFDGVPVNDPFGGWVQWSRVSPTAVETVEVFRGGASSLYGSGGLSGAVGIIPKTADDRLDLSAVLFAGSQRTFSGSAFAGTSNKEWTADLSVGHFQTRGFIPVDENERGPADSYAGVRSINSSVRIGREFGKAANVLFRHNYFGESRTNGTPGQINRTHSRQFVLGMGSAAASLPKFEGRVYGGTQVYDQTFTAVSADRSSESLSRVQRSPSQHLGFSGTVSMNYRRHTIAAGVEGREVRGSSDEVGYFGGRATSLLGAGGRERSVGAFARDVIRLSHKVLIGGGIRHDRWKNLTARSTTTSLITRLSAITLFPDRYESAWSPSASILVQPNDTVSFHAAASRSFRAPTLNELYRGFRVGNVVTNSNENLRAELATNLETGGALRRGHTGFRVTAFFVEVDRTVSNVTLSITPSLITRQRQNAGTTRTAGVEVDAETRINKLEINAGYLFADSRVTRFPSNPALVDKLIPQVPQHQFTFQTRVPWRAWTFSLQGRAASDQFDDDLNELRLEPYFQLDAFVSKKIRDKFEIFAAVENAFNSRYSVGRTPVRTTSSPTNARVGIRWN